MTKPLQALAKFIGESTEDGAGPIDRNLYISREALAGGALVLYKNFLESTRRMRAPRVDGTGKVEVYELIMIKLFEPATESAALHAETTAIPEAHSEGFLEAMSDTPIKDFLEDGKFANATEETSGKTGESHSSPRPSTW